MGKCSQAALAVATAFSLAACTSVASTPPPAPVAQNKALQNAGQPFPPRPLTLLYTTFQDHAVLQRGKPIPVWGLAKPGATVSVSFAGETASATADSDGHWKATLGALKAGGPYEMTAKSSSGESQTITDVMMGDVYLCSGQSNMEMPLKFVSNYGQDVNGASNKSVRLFHVQRFSSATPRRTFGADASWAVTSPETVPDFSAACYFFGRDLQPAVDVPLGLIEDSWGGSVIQTWLSTEAVRKLGGYEHQLAVMAQYARDPAGSKKRWLEFTDGWWRKHDPASSAAVPWSDPSFDDSSWAQIVPAGDWEGWSVPSLRDFDGIVWMRKTIELTAAQAKMDAMLSLGPVDDIDTTWVNGKQVGGEEGWDTPRVYAIPAGTLHAGKNVIAVGILDTGAGGGMWGPPDDKAITFSDGTRIGLGTPWRYKISAPLSQTGSMPHAPWLKESGLSMLYNGMIVPLGPTQVRGILWYQGESDADHPQEYARLLPALIHDWRHRFGTDVPFLIVQLPGYGPPSTAPEQSNWAEIREVERRTADSVPDTGLAATIDLGQRDNIHPTNKQEVGRRLALVARKLIYGQDIVASGPTPLAAVKTGRTVKVHFGHVADGLEVYESNRPISFQLCDADKHCRFVDARQDGNLVTLDASKSPRATLVRFCWSDSPICNLYNSAGLPAVPFEMPITAKASRHRRGHAR